MWKVKMVSLLLVTAVMATACGKTESSKSEVLLYQPSVESGAIEEEKNMYDTTTVRKETYKEIYYDTAELDYTDTEEIYIQEEDAVLDSVKVKKYDKVKKGDVLAIYHVETSKTKLEKERLMVQQARANYESGLSNLLNMLSQQQKALKQVPTAAERKIKQLEIKKMKKEIEAYKKGEKEVREQEKNYNNLLKMQNKTKLIAKRSGTVTETAKSFEGEDITASDKIVELRSNDEWVLKVKDPDGMLRYNMEVSVRLGKSMKDYSHEVKGKVITASDITGVEETDEEGNNIVYIDISNANKKKYDFENNNVYVHAVSFSVKDAFLVDAEAVYKEAVEHSNKLYVYVVEDGNLHKRYIVSNYNNENEYLVEQGVSEGQTLAVIDDLFAGRGN